MLCRTRTRLLKRIDVSEEVKWGIEEERMAALGDEDCDFLRDGLQEVMY